MVATKIAETTLHIGTNSATLAAETAWEAVTGFRSWTGNFGGTWAVADTSTLADIVNKSAKTTLEMGTITIVVIEDEDDDGLTDLKAADADGTSDLPYNFKLTDARGNMYRFKAHVTSGFIGAGNRNAIYERSFSLDLQTQIEKVAA